MTEKRLVARDLGGSQTDVFILSEAEDLVALIKKNPNGKWARDGQGNLVYDEEARNDYKVKRYRPRIEGLFRAHRTLGSP